MPEIRQLPPGVINKIAAGEVIERPASLVKELVENALDAGATRVDVAVEQGGLELVRVSDNGCGMSAEQLPLAVASHATSKIRHADDLFRVRTLGFRGEALASIAEVSRLVLRSRTSETAAGAQLEVCGGELRDAGPCGCPTGTTVEVHQLFFNTPVRRKFLRSTQTEMGHVAEAFTRLALAFPQIHFSLRHNGRPIHELPPADDGRGRVAAFFGDELARDLIAVASCDQDVTLSGYVAGPAQSRAHPRMQYLFLNGRAIRDRALQHALGEAYRGLLLTGRYPIAFLRIEMPPELVDVNVHPTKAEVRFQDSGRLYSQLLGTLRSKFLATDLTHRLEPASEAGEATGMDARRANAVREELVAWAKGELDSALATAEPGDDSAAAPAPVALFPHTPLQLNRIDRPFPAAAAATLTGGARTVPAAPPEPRLAPRTPPAMQVHNRYLITENEEGVVVIDQHALHERILYERLRERVAGGAVESQNLLVPEPVELSPAEAAAALQAGPVLERLGISVTAFGGSTVLVGSYPAMLAATPPAQVLRDVVELLLAGPRSPEPRDVLDELLHMISCKAAIKAGDRLSADEISALLEQRHLAQDTHHCPHGRPTALVFTRQELDRQFKRI